MSVSIRKVPKELYNCATEELKMAWVKRALKAGSTLSDSGLWLGGVDRPEQLIEKLRKAGVRIETTTMRVVDAADEPHDDVAWRLA